MLKTVLLVAAGLAAGFAVAVWLQPHASPEPRVAPVDAAAQSAASASAGPAPDTRRLEQLETALQAEGEQRAALEQRVGELGAELDELRAAATERRTNERATATSSGETPPQGFAPGDIPAGLRGRFRGQETPQQQIDRLVAAGFTPDRAAWIQQRTAQITMETLQAQYTARRDGQPVPAALAAGGEQTLRSELGDSDYERYLAAQGRPTRVGVFNVLAGSPGEQAGLHAGDEIVSYGGKRVFDMGDLNGLTYEGNSGEPVLVEVVREGATLQLVVPRGPIGIGGGPFFRRP